MSQIELETSQPASAAEAAAFLKLFANEDRLTLLGALDTGDRTVSELEAATGIKQPTLSQQLAVLRNDGLVDTVREGKYIRYRLKSGRASVLIAVMNQLFCHADH